MIGGIDPNDGAALAQADAAIRDALASLQRLGRAADADVPLQDAEQTSYEDIASDSSRSQDWKTTQTARRYIATLTTLATKLTGAAERGGTQDSSDAASVFGVAGLSGDPASLAISRRDAGDRVADIGDPFKLRDLLASAVRNGDEVLAHAIAEVAITSGDVDTINAFTAAYPRLADAVGRLWAAEHQKMTTADVTVAWRVAALKPAALASLQPYEIQAAAAGNTSVGRWNVEATT